MSRPDTCDAPTAVRLGLGRVLPDAPHPDDPCAVRLCDELESRADVSATHLVAAGSVATTEVCVHGLPGVAGADLRVAAQEAGDRLTRRFGHLRFPVGERPDDLRARLSAQPGVVGVGGTVDGHATIEFDRTLVSELELRSAIDETAQPDRSGHEHAAHDHAGHDHDHSHGPFGERGEIVFALLAGAAYATGVLISLLTEASDAVPRAFYLAAYGFGGFFTVREAFESIRARRFEVDFLMLVAAVGAAALGKFAEGAVLLFLFSLGHALEHYAMGRARRAIEALAELAPTTALVRHQGTEREVPVEAVKVGDIVVTKPNMRLAADGFVIEGTSSIDQAAVTGESIPVDKRPVPDVEAARRAADSLAAEHRVFAGTINGTGALAIMVTRGSQDNTLARVVRLVASAQTQISPTQRFTDRFERIFVPSVLTLVGLLLFAWVAIDESFSDSFYRAMAVLVAASPCALAISTPSAVLSGVARAARGGVLVKGGGPLEDLGRLTAIAFDKTGTLTEGRPTVTDVAPADGVTEVELLSTAVAIERLSDHPLAGAVVRDGLRRLDAEPSILARDVRSVTGRGVEATIDGSPAWIGSSAMFSELAGPPLPAVLLERAAVLEEQGRTTMIVRRDDRYLGVIGLMDTPRQSAAPVIAQLRSIGIRRTILISGDNQRVADAVAAQVGVDEAWGDLLPEDKVDAIQRLEQREGRVAMVGDGVNDAPAMANSTVGIAMGAAGSDVALETADVALMSDDLGQLPFATALSRRTSRVIKQNLFASLGIVAVLIPATILGLGIGPAVLVHEGSTLLVVSNALRLLAFRPA